MVAAHKFPEVQREQLERLLNGIFNGNIHEHSIESLNYARFNKIQLYSSENQMNFQIDIG